MMKYSKNAVRLSAKNGLLAKMRKQMIIYEVRKQYDSDDELAILRQASAKPEEYNTYFAYVETCKQNVDKYIQSILGGRDIG